MRIFRDISRIFLKFSNFRGRTLRASKKPLKISKIFQKEPKNRLNYQK